MAHTLAKIGQSSNDQATYIFQEIAGDYLHFIYNPAKWVSNHLPSVCKIKNIIINA